MCFQMPHLQISKNIALEVTFDLSMDACILAIRKFINKRGVPTKLRTDNGKNFVGAYQIAKRFSEVFEGFEFKMKCL